MADIANLVRQTSASTGAGTLTLANVNGYRSFNAAFGTGGADTFYYFIAHRAAAEWEYGTGHLSDATTLVRDTVVASSNSNAAVAFSAGTKDVMNDLPAEMQAHLNRANTWTGRQTIDSVTGNGDEIPMLLRYTESGAGIGPDLTLLRASSSPAASDFLGGVRVVGQNSTGGAIDYARLGGAISSPTAAAEIGMLYFGTRSAGAMQIRVYIREGVYSPGAADGDKGAGTLNFVEIYEDGSRVATLDQIPPAQVPADWDATTGVARILNVPSAFPPTAHTHNAGDINAGTLAIARLPTGTAAGTVALGNHTHGAATTGAAGFMSATDKAKLDGIASGATANTGTVTSVTASVPTGLNVAGGPITTTGTLAITWASGYRAYTDTEAGKLAGIEAGADVTDATNVAAAGAAMLAVENQTLTGGASVTAKSLGIVSSGTLVLDMGDRPLQSYNNNGPHTLSPGTVFGMCIVDILNNAGAGAITTSGWTLVTGDDFTTTSGDRFRCHCSVGGNGSLLVVQALQ